MKLKMFLRVWKNSLDEAIYDEPVYSFTSGEDSDCSEYWISLGEVEIEFDLPPMPSDEELTNRQVKYLRKGREEVVKEFTTKLANIDEQIEELLALPAPKTDNE